MEHAIIQGENNVRYCSKCGKTSFEESCPYGFELDKIALQREKMVVMSKREHQTDIQRCERRHGSVVGAEPGRESGTHTSSLSSKCTDKSAVPQLIDSIPRPAYMMLDSLYTDTGGLP